MAQSGSLPTGRHRRHAIAAILVLAQLPVGRAWCCRACGKCMCELYGVCPAPAQASSTSQSALHALSVADVAAFVESIGPNGSRQTCPSACPLVGLLNASLFVRGAVDGRTLARLVRAHDDRAWVHNETLRAAHAEMLAEHRVFGGGHVGLKSEQRIALMTRLRDALRHAGYLAAPATPPGAPAATPAEARDGARRPRQLMHARSSRRTLQRRKREK